MALRKKIIFVSGPTASGKSYFSINLAQTIGGSIINADSMQVYKDLRILTSRPSLKDERLIEHFLYGHILGNTRYNVYNWCQDCSKKIKEIIENNKIPIIVGGTGLYFHSLINGISSMPSIPESIKIESSKQLKKHGWDGFFSIVNKLDPLSCEKLKKNDSQRLKRIWEVFYYSKIPLSSWLKNKMNKFIESYDYELILIKPDQKIIYNNCNNRFIKMIEQGVVEEVKELKLKKYDLSFPIMKAHGVPEIMNYINGILTLEETILRVQKVTRNYVKRQLTWWRGSNLKVNQVIEDYGNEIDLKNLSFVKKNN